MIRRNSSFFLFPLAVMNVLGFVFLYNDKNKTLGQMKTLPPEVKFEQRKETHCVPNKTRNVLIALAISDDIDIRSFIQTFECRQHQTKTFWYFNVYNARNDSKTQGGDNWRVVTKPITKIRFWVYHINPFEVKKEFNTSFNFVWFVDQDLELSSFSFERFVDIAVMLDAGLAQPGIIAGCPTCRGSDHSTLNQGSMSDASVIAKSTDFIEIMSPLIKWNVWTKVHEKLKIFIDVYHFFNVTNWGPDFWWCGLAQHMMETNLLLLQTPCVVIHGSPIIHLDTRTIAKDKMYLDQSRRESEIQKQVLSNFTNINIEKRDYYVNDPLFAKKNDQLTKIGFI